MPSHRPNIIRLVEADTIRPSTYNPRTADPERLELVALSLRKLGWLLPIYADATGEILSGHQRHYVATEILGMTKLPVVHTKPFSLEQRKAINIAFNRGTNDMATETTSYNLAEAIRDSDVVAMAAGLPDSTDLYPCQRTAEEPIYPLLAANKGTWNRHAKVVSRMLSHRGIEMPVIVDEHDKVINGVGRLEHYATRKYPTVPVLRLRGKTAELARAMLNLLTMDFDIHNRYRDDLRFNSFRRTAHIRTTLGLGFTFAVIGSKNSDELQVTNPTHLSAWKKVHGDTVIDFGAGHLTETKLLRSVGVDVTPFEPFRCDPNRADTVMREESTLLGRELLRQVGEGKQWTSVFISSVLNSVPFIEDRRHIITLLAAMTGNGRCYAVAKSVAHGSWKTLTGGSVINSRNASYAGFSIGYEPGTVLTDLADQPKAQKYHTVDELRALFKERFGEVHAAHSQANVQIIAGKPLPVDPQALAAACDFEFNLMYPDGKRMGLGDYAREQFGKRHGVDLSR